MYTRILNYFIFIIGAQLYSFEFDDYKQVPNNSVIVTDSFGQIPPIQCISGSTRGNSGKWIAPSSEDITADSFGINIGGSNDPGFIEIFLMGGYSLTFNDQGVYTCLIPDESDKMIPLRLGIYLPAYASKL